MRLICPNCGAQYEVDGSVIPDAGRDVQCSNCGHTWFQRQAQQEAEIADQQADALAVEQAKDGEIPPTEAEAEPEPDADADADASADDAPEASPVAGQLSDAEPAQPDSSPQRQPMDEDVANVLREEGELEASKRSAESAAADVQPASEPERPSGDLETVPQERSAQLQAGDDKPSDYQSHRKELLPNIEEINSTLAATNIAQDDPDEDNTAEERRHRGFRRGFSLAVSVFAIMALVYVFAPIIADGLPGTATTLASYVHWINTLRTSVDGIMLGAVEKLTGLLAQISGGAAG